MQRLRNDKPKGALAQNPAKIVGFDPMPLCFLQYQFLQFFALENRLSFEMLGIEELLYFEKNFEEARGKPDTGTNLGRNGYQESLPTLTFQNLILWKPTIVFHIGRLCLLNMYSFFVFFSHLA